MLVGGHRTASTVVLRHITNLPSMTFRADTLVLKFCLRFNGLPDDCLLSLLSSSVPSSLLTQLRKRQIVLDYPSDAPLSSSRLASWLRRF
ncbi:hypothetical protein G6F60_015396 [Rhizopus arrhizus]|nr:hypothetical protein G6F37_014253 [Rhizopus arrhizus]KAG1128832.1 hypothetical protein G6F37_014174 [Rhizopus arrhizus]KAG1376185.1 hypothetical protein G6F60_015396 [Rhizopus arrhizus]